MRRRTGRTAAHEADALPRPHADPARPESFDVWLDGSLGPEALQPADESALREWIVSNRVNRTGYGDDDPTMVEPVAQVGLVGPL